MTTPPSPTPGKAETPPAPPPITSPRPAQPYYAQSYVPPAGRSPGAGWWIGAVIVAGVLVVGAYLIGHDAGENAERDHYAAGAPGYDAIYRQGVTAGTAQGTQKGQAQGAAAGKQVGFQQGEQTGTAQGERQGTAAGANAALGGFSAWEPGTPYIVKVQAGTSSIPYEIDSRTQLEPATEYALCRDQPTQVCTIQK